MIASEPAYALLTVLLGTLLCISATLVEIGRQRTAGLVDFQFATTAIWVALFGVSPILVYFLWEGFAIPPEWAFVAHIPPTSPYYTFAVALGLGSYFLLLLGLRLGRRKTGRGLRLASTAKLAVFGCVFTLTGLVSLYVYASDIGGIQFMLETIMAYRASGEPVYTSLGFLKTLSPIATAGAFVVFAAIQAGRRSLLMYIFFAAALLISLLALLVNGGRLMVIQFVLAFPLYYLLRSGDRLLAPMLVVGSLTFATFVVFGHGIFDLFRGSERITEQLETASRNTGEVLARVGLEFAYPVQSLAVTLRDAGSEPYELRWFWDFPLAVAYLLPKRLLGLDLPETVSMQVSDLLNAPLPADLITFGYWSAGPIGVVIVAAGFGWLLSRFEAWFPYCREPGILTLRAAWIAYLCSRVMYGNPHHTFITALPLVAATVAIVLASKPPVSADRARVDSSLLRSTP